MTISFRAYAETHSASNSVITLAATVPTNSAGDLLVAFISVSSAQTMTTEPGGWTLLTSVSRTGGATSNEWVYYKVSSGSEPSTYSWGWANTGGGIIGIAAYQGARIVAGSAATSTRTTTTTSITTASITTSSSNWIVSFFADASGSTWTLGDTSRIAYTRTSAASLAVQDTNGYVTAGTYSKTATGSVSTNAATSIIFALQDTTTPTTISVTSGTYRVVDLRASTDPDGAITFACTVNAGLTVTQPVSGLFFVTPDSSTHTLTFSASQGGDTVTTDVSVPPLVAATSIRRRYFNGTALV